MPQAAEVSWHIRILRFFRLKIYIPASRPALPILLQVKVYFLFVLRIYINDQVYRQA